LAPYLWTLPFSIFLEPLTLYPSPLGKGRGKVIF
jgi:hypothetical protein